VLVLFEVFRVVFDVFHEEESEGGVGLVSRFEDRELAVE
jgi:hypothetical protein